ncbi:DUF3467 domain-containing protein [soil metagenome]
MSDEPKKGPMEAAPAQGQFAVSTDEMSTGYANFCRVTGTPEELVLDFGLNTTMQPVANEPVKLTHRLVVNFFTAKRLLMALSMAVQQHEQVYGVLETDITKRVRQQGPGGAPNAPRPGTTPNR